MYQVSPQLAGVTALMVPTIIGIGTALGSFLRSVSKAAQDQVFILCVNLNLNSIMVLLISH